MNKSRHVTFRCTQEQYDDVKKYADSLGLSVSTVMQRLCKITAKSYLSLPLTIDLKSDKS